MHVRSIQRDNVSEEWRPVIHSWERILLYVPAQLVSKSATRSS